MAKDRNNADNPYFEGFSSKGYTPVWHAIECAYCTAKVGEHCIVLYTRTTTRRMANEIHQVRRQTQKAAYDAWERGHKAGHKAGREQVAGVIETALAVVRTIDEPKLKSVG